jgi:hypothetical protein
MSSRRTSLTAARIALVAAAVSLGLLGSVGPASADPVDPVAASVAVTPAVGLLDGQVVDVAVTGFAAGEGLTLSQCVQLPAGFACNGVDRVLVTADETGAVSAPVTVRATFEGVDPATGIPTGPIDCAVVEGGCRIGAANADFSNIGSAAISFGELPQA